MEKLKTRYKDVEFECGVDEVGRGCCAGPVVAAAVILPRDFYHPKLKDSKKMTEKARIEVDKYIREHAISYAIAEVSPADIDRINILNASILAMHKSIHQLSPKPQFIIVDGNQFKPYFEGDLTIDHECHVKGDANWASIAAASVLAKVYRDTLMEKLDKDFPGYGWASNKGYITKEHLQAIADKGYNDQHRKSYSLVLPPKQIFS